MIDKETNITNNFAQRLLVLPLIILLSLLLACTGSDSVSASSISKELICQCGCDEVLSTCDCSTAESMTTLIEEKLNQSQSKVQIIQYFIDQYGEKILVE